MIKLAVFDLDGTLAEPGKGISQQDVSLLKELEKTGARIAVCSGKPAYYLCGLLRQAQLAAPILIGEVGATIQFGVDLPPREHYRLCADGANAKAFDNVKAAILAAVPDMWFQPNEVNLSPFPKSESEFEAVEAVIRQNAALLHDVNIYRYSDAVDFVPKGVDKGTAVRFLADRLGLQPEEIAAIGDSSNDYSMFACAGISIGINLADKSKADYHVSDCSEAISFLLRQQ